MATRPTVWVRCGLAGLAAVLALYLFWPTFSWMAYEFGLPRNDLSHGWIVPFFSAFVVWMRRRELWRGFVEGRPDWRGMVAVFFGVALFWLGSRGGQMRFCQIALLFQIWAIPFALFGVRVARLMVFPAAFMAFTVPMGFLDFFTVRLRLLTAAVASLVLNGLGIPVVRDGTGMHSLAGAGFSLDVADPCSGLRSLFAMTALTAAYSFLNLRGRFRQWVLFLLAVPLAVVGNAVRIFSIAVVALLFGADAATGFYHDYSGYVVFLVAVLLMIQVGALINKAPVRSWEVFFEPKVAPDTDATQRAWRRSDFLCAGAVPVVIVGVLMAQAYLPQAEIESADFIATSLPETLTGYRSEAPLFCHNEQCLHRMFQSELPGEPHEWKCLRCGGGLYDRSLGETTVLPADTKVVKRVYTDDAGSDIEVSMVVSGLSRMSIHRPELCLPAQGFAMSDARSLAVPMPDRDPLRVRLVSVQKGPARFLLVYWFRSREHETESHVVRILRDAWARSVHNRINRWVMFALTVNLPSESDAAEETVRGVVADIYPRMLVGEGVTVW